MIATLATAADPGWKPFLTPLPVWDYWFWLLIPLALGVALAYKSTKCGKPDHIVRESLVLTLWIVGGLIAAAIGIAVVVRFV